MVTCLLDNWLDLELEFGGLLLEITDLLLGTGLSVTEKLTGGGGPDVGIGECKWEWGDTLAKCDWAVANGEPGKPSGEIIGAQRCCGKCTVKGLWFISCKDESRTNIWSTLWSTSPDPGLLSARSAFVSKHNALPEKK